MINKSTKLSKKDTQHKRLCIKDTQPNDTQQNNKNITLSIKDPTICHLAYHNSTQHTIMLIVNFLIEITLYYRLLLSYSQHSIFFSMKNGTNKLEGWTPTNLSGLVYGTL